MTTQLHLLRAMLADRWRSVRSDEGASTIEYVILVVLGIAVATTVTVLVTNAVTTRGAGIR
jgi:hypothetical protein